MPRLNLSNKITNLSEIPVATNGAFADVWTGSVGGIKVAIKRIRHSLTSDHGKLEKVWLFRSSLTFV
jgi:hypothetical protein